MRTLRQRGFSLVLAVFLLVTLAAMGAYLLTVSTLQQEAVVQDELGARAYQAARTGVDWATYQILQAPASGFTAACNAATPAAPTVENLPLGIGLAGFSANVSCGSSSHTELGAPAIRAYVVIVTGCNRAACPGTPGTTYVERQLQVTLAR